MTYYEKNSEEFRLLLKIVSKLAVKFETASHDEVISFVSSNFNVRRPEAIINDLVDNPGLVKKVDDENVYFNNEKGGEEELSEEMKIILEVVSSEPTSRQDILEALKEKGLGRRSRSLLGEARKQSLIKGIVINKVPSYVRI